MTEPAPSAAETPGAVLFDVDGTLVDTDVEQSKPSPEIVAKAFEAAGAPAARCVMVGDTAPVT